MRAYESLLEKVRDAGATLIEEHRHPEAFGSAYAVFSCGTDGKFRIVWDGKENCGLIQTLVGAEKWVDERPIVRERFSGGFSNLQEFLATAARLSLGGSV